MKIEMGKLNEKECENKTMKEIIETVIMPDIQKEAENRIGHREPKNFDELIEILKKEHTETFKDVTLEAQLDKFVDEQQEFINADNCLEEARELADMIIVAAGIARFAPRFVDEVIHPYIQRKIGDEEKINSVICYMALEKSLINKKRKWKKLSTVNGVKYQHE